MELPIAIFSEQHARSLFQSMGVEELSHGAHFHFMMMAGDGFVCGRVSCGKRWPTASLMSKKEVSISQQAWFVVVWTIRTPNILEMKAMDLNGEISFGIFFLNRMPWLIRWHLDHLAYQIPWSFLALNHPIWTLNIVLMGTRCSKNCLWKPCDQSWSTIFTRNGWLVKANPNWSVGLGLPQYLYLTVVLMLGLWALIWHAFQCVRRAQ